MLLFTFEKDSLVVEGGKLTRVKDLSDNGNDATVNTQGGKAAGNLKVKPSGPPKEVEGKFGGALYFDGTNFLEVLESKTIDIRDTITLEAWVKPEVLTTGDDNMTVATKDTCYYMVLRNNGFLANYQYGVAPPGYHLSKKQLKANEWTHIAVTYDGKDVNLYINGEVDTKIAANGKIVPAIPGQSLGIGAEVRIPSRGAPNIRYFQGVIDEVRVSDVARTKDEIRESIEKGFEAVEASGKLAITWGRMKRN
jgi:hypothetical protein